MFFVGLSQGWQNGWLDEVEHDATPLNVDFDVCRSCYRFFFVNGLPKVNSACWSSNKLVPPIVYRYKKLVLSVLNASEDITLLDLRNPRLMGSNTD